MLLLVKFPLWKAVKYYSPKSNNVVWINIFGIKYYIDQIIWDSAIISSLILSRRDYRIFFGKKIGKLHNKNIFFSLNKYFDFNLFINYSKSISNIIAQLEVQGNKVLPNSREVLFWENKVYMHKEFDRLNILTPKSYLIEKVNDIKSINLNYPYLLKYVHSYHSKGIYKMESYEQTRSFLIKYYNEFPNSKFIAQELLDIRKDIRIILIGDEIIQYYWRVNPSDEWKPTSTSHGSAVDFVSFPDRSRKYIIEMFQKLRISTGAFDIAFRNDDLNSLPLVLEISSHYSPNPIIDTSNMKQSYGELRRKTWNSFDKLYIDTIFEIKNKHLVHFFLTSQSDSRKTYL
jgi:glutathione synthase/RimK-type ligase-like ATP-grasp enzyme